MAKQGADAVSQVFKDGGWDPEWERIFQTESWGRYPSESLVRFIGRELKTREDRSSIRVLEIGSGNGSQIWFLAREGLDAHGVEGSETAVRQCLERLDAEQLSATVLVGDAIALEYEDASFDYVIDIQCLTCMPVDIAVKAVAEARRVLKPGGKLFSQTLKAPESDDPAAQRGRHHERKRFLRKTDRAEIEVIYSQFAERTVDRLLQTRENQATEIEEWLIECRK